MAEVQRSSAVAPGAPAGIGATESVPAVQGTERGAAAAPGNDPVPAGDAPAPAAGLPGAVGAAGFKPPSTDQVKAAVKDANHALQAIGTQLVFVFDDQSRHLSVKLLDVQTQKVVQQIPGQAMAAKASALAAAPSSGALVDTKA